MCVHGRNVGVIARGAAGGTETVGLFFAIDLVVHLLLNGTSLLPATALKTPMSVYLTLVICANSTSHTHVAVRVCRAVRVCHAVRVCRSLCVCWAFCFFFFLDVAYLVHNTYLVSYASGT